MAGHIEFLFDVGSPTTYLAYRRLPAIALRTGATVVYVPVLLGGVFKATGNASPAAVAAKAAYMDADMARFAAREWIALRPNPYFPVNTLQMMRGAAALQGTPALMPYLDAVFDAMWADARDMGDAGVVAEVLAAAGIDAGEVMALAAGDDAKARLKANTEAAVARGVFGAPTFFVGETMYFGQDRLDWVEAAVTR